MQLGDSVPRSPLNKPLHQLTEDDISQLTREDCRRYLKDKGMRRPSWNKSQAIQQVISLKTLLETTPGSDGNDAKKRLYIPRLDNSQQRALANSSVSAKETSGNAPMSPSPVELVPYLRHDPPNNDFPGDPPVCLVAAENDSLSPRTTSAAGEPVGQMTIFYCGEVNVYDDVPKEKAESIMQLAACPFSSSLETSSNSLLASWSIPRQLETPGFKTAPSSPMFIFPTLHTGKVAENFPLFREESKLSHDVNLGPTSRKASVQRYLEKRKDRFKSKRKIAMPSSTSSDISLNLTDACSMPQPKAPHTPKLCSSDENIAKHTHLSTSLHYKVADFQEC
ncbi:protein TIFY 4B-like isoform X2 [Euphorbia lathyris]|uniref:protein TIFY 4B-like isoform X2 n=1 Tax=Euphorbia lathyris TaxID=212925 RepID=UPI0033142FCC